MDIKLYNTLTRKEEIFKPIRGKEVSIYVCGPTVNDVPHLGHARQQITFDILRKVLEFNGYKVKFVSNITDIDDKIIAKAIQLKESINALTKRNILAHKEDYKKIGVSQPDIQPKATEYIKEMTSLIKSLEKKGYTYIIENEGVYFRVSKFKEYGKLSGQNKKENKKSRIGSNEKKESEEDFVLWKFSKPTEPKWKSPWGDGRPGWHIECSAMSHSILGLPFDIHGGGQDLIFPHHEDEIAQSKAAYGKDVANIWIHNAMVNVDNVKMSKSLGNFTTIKDLLKEYDGKIIRYFVLSSHYRKPIDFTSDNLDSIKNAYENLKSKIIEIKNAPLKGNDLTEKYSSEFMSALNDDLNTPKALQVLWNAVNDIDFNSSKKILLLQKFDSVLGLGIKEMKEKKIKIPKEVADLAKKREELRKKKMWAEADILRERIKELGFTIEDSAEEIKIRKLT